MRSLRLSIVRADLVQALRVLGTHRRRRFTSVVPVWLQYDPGAHELWVGGDQANIRTAVKALGEWPAAGTTVDLFLLRQAIKNNTGEQVELHAIDEAVLVPTARGHVVLKLLPFGPVPRKPEQPAPQSHRRYDWHRDLPLFRWQGNRSNDRA